MTYLCALGNWRVNRSIVPALSVEIAIRTPREPVQFLNVFNRWRVQRQSEVKTDVCDAIPSYGTCKRGDVRRRLAVGRRRRWIDKRRTPRAVRLPMGNADA